MPLLNVRWQRAIIPQAELLDYLNRLNFQPGKFFVLPANLDTPSGVRSVEVYYVVTEEEPKS